MIGAHCEEGGPGGEKPLEGRRWRVYGGGEPLPA